MTGYLLDTNAVSDWLIDTKPRHPAVRAKIASLPADSPLLTSVIVLGEIEYGLRVDRDNQPTLEPFRERVRQELPHVLTVEKATADVYGGLRAKLFDKFTPKGKRKGPRPEQLVDPVTSLALGIQENDLWIAAQAIERNLVLVSNDGMKRIRDVAPELRVEDWGQSKL